MATKNTPTGLGRAYEQLMQGTVWVYARKSFAQAEEKHKKSVDDQVAECLEVCQDEELPTPGDDDVFLEAKNHGGDEWWEAFPERGLPAMWSDRRRPILTEVMLGVVEGRCKAIVVWHTDRLHRSVGIAQEFINLLAKHHVRLFDRNGEIPLATPDARAAYLSTAVSTQHYRETCAINSPRGIKRSASKGGLVTDANTLGFRSAGRFTKEVVHIPAEQAKVNELYDWCLQGMTYSKIATRLMEEGYDWTSDLHAKRGKKRNEFTTTIIYDWQVKRVLTDPRYIGKQRWNGEEWPCPAYLVDGAREVVEPAKWHAVQAVVALRSNGGNATQNHRPLTGILKCGLCGQGLCVSTTNTFTKDDDGNIIKIPYWKAVHSKSDSCYWCTHTLPSIRESMLDDYVEKVLAPLLLAEIRDRALIHSGDARLSDRATLSRQLQEAVRYYEEELPTFKDISPRLLALKEQACQKEIKELRERIREADSKVMSLEQAARHLENYHDLSSEVRRDVVQAVLRWVAVLPSNAPREPYPGRANKTRPAQDQGRIVFLTAYGTYHTCVVELNRTQTDRRRQNTLRPSTATETIGTVADFPDAAGFLEGLRRAFQGGHYAHNPETLCPGYTRDRQQPVAEFDVEVVNIS